MPAHVANVIAHFTMPRRRQFGVWPQIGFRLSSLDAFTLTLSPKPLSQISDEIRPSGHILCASPTQHKECAYVAGDREISSCVQAGMWQAWWQHCVHLVAFTVVKAWQTWCWHCGEKVAAKWKGWWQLRLDDRLRATHVVALIPSSRRLRSHIALRNATNWLLGPSDRRIKFALFDAT